MNITTNIRLIIVSSLTACTALLAMPGTARGQIIYETNSGGNTIGEYDASTGAAINAALVSGLNLPQDIVVSGGNLWVLNGAGPSQWRIGEYNATTGAAINASLVSGLPGGVYFALSGGNLWVATDNAGTIAEYNATTGATVNSSLVSGLNKPQGIVVSGGNLWVANNGGNTIGEYNATTGATVNASLVSVNGRVCREEY